MQSFAVLENFFFSFSFKEACLITKYIVQLHLEYTPLITLWKEKERRNKQRKIINRVSSGRVKIIWKHVKVSSHAFSEVSLSQNVRERDFGLLKLLQRFEAKESI